MFEGAEPKLEAFPVFKHKCVFNGDLVKKSNKSKVKNDNIEFSKYEQADLASFHSLLDIAACIQEKIKTCFYLD